MRSEFGILLRHYLRSFCVFPIVGGMVALVLMLAIVSVLGIGPVGREEDGAMAAIFVLALLVSAISVILFAVLSEQKVEREHHLSTIVRFTTLSQARFAAALILCGGSSAAVAGAAAFSVSPAYERYSLMIGLLTGFMLVISLLFWLLATEKSLLVRAARWFVKACVVGLSALSVVLFCQASPAPLFGLAASIAALVVVFVGILASVGKVDPAECRPALEPREKDKFQGRDVVVSTTWFPSNASDAAERMEVGRFRRAWTLVGRCDAVSDSTKYRLFLVQGTSLLLLFQSVILGTGFIYEALWIVSCISGFSPLTRFSRGTLVAGADVASRRLVFHILLVPFTTTIWGIVLLSGLLGGKPAVLEIESRASVEGNAALVAEFNRTGDPGDWSKCVSVCAETCFRAQRNAVCLAAIDDKAVRVFDPCLIGVEKRDACLDAQFDDLEAREDAADEKGQDVDMARGSDAARPRTVLGISGKEVNSRLNLSDDYFRRQLKTFYWNSCGVSDVAPSRGDEGDSSSKYFASKEGVWSASPQSADDIRSAATRLKMVELALLATGFFVFLVAVFPPWRRAHIWLSRFKTARDVGLFLGALAIAAVFALWYARQSRALVFDDELELVRSPWGAVLHVAQTYWWLWVALCAVACFFLYRAALRGFLMTDIAPGWAPRMWRKRGEAGR